jgi:predicted DsbA family dithiol-disulfide isomerase
MVLLGSLAFLTYFDRVCISRAVDPIRADLNLTKEQMGLIMGAFWFAYALFELPTGWLGDRYGARVTWLPFDLHPEYPPEGITRDDLRRRYGPGVDEHQRRMFERSGQRFSPAETIPNSRDALRVTELARDRGLHEQVHDRLMDAFWGDGRNLGDRDELRALAVDAGLDAAEVDDVLDSDAYLERVLASTAEAQSIGINGIPAFVLDGRLLLLGAQPREVFEQAFAQLE